MSAPETTTSGCRDVCSLPPEELRKREAMLRRELLPKALRREALQNGWSLDFPATPVLRKALEDLVAFERECCSSLSWNLERRGDDVVRLRVEGLPPESRFFEGLWGAATAPPAGSELPRIAKAIGLGAGASLLVCCLAPLGLAAVLGGSAVAPLARLDDPVTIALGAIVLAICAWLWLRRHPARCDGGCSK